MEGINVISAKSVERARAYKEFWIPASAVERIRPKPLWRMRWNDHRGAPIFPADVRNKTRVRVNIRL